MVVVHLLPGKTSGDLDRTEWGFDCHHVVEGQLGCGNMAKALGKMQIVIASLSEDKEEQEYSVCQSHEVDFSGTKLWSQWLIEPPHKPPLLHRQNPRHLRFSSLRSSSIRRGQDLTEDIDGDEGDDGREVGIIAGLIKEFSSLLDLGGRQSDEVVKPAHGCRIPWNQAVSRIVMPRISRRRGGGRNDAS